MRQRPEQRRGGLEANRRKADRDERKHRIRRGRREQPARGNHQRQREPCLLEAPFRREQREAVHRDDGDHPRNRVVEAHLEIRQAAHLADDRRQPERGRVDRELDREVEKTEQHDLRILQQAHDGHVRAGRGFALGLFARHVAFERALLVVREPVRVANARLQQQPARAAEHDRERAFDQEHPLPAREAETAHREQRARDRPGQHRGERRARQKHRHRLAARLLRQPLREVIHHARKEPRFGDPEQKTQQIERGVVLHERHRARHETPRSHDAREPGARAVLLHQHVRRHFEQRVTDEKQTAAEPVGRRGEAQIGLHVRIRETDVHAVDVVRDEHDQEERQHVPHDLGAGRIQQVVVTLGGNGHLGLSPDRRPRIGVRVRRFMVRCLTTL
ncbi:hypothetical protein PT2222_150138 [Paraburkholderia tropica]